MEKINIIIYNDESKGKKFGMIKYFPTDGCTSRWNTRERGKSGIMMCGNKDSAMAY